MKMDYLKIGFVICMFLLFFGCAGNSQNANELQSGQNQISDAEVVAESNSLENNGDLVPEPNSKQESESAEESEESGVERIEIIHFHGTNQCYSCIMVGDYAEETVNTYFAGELKSGKITFSHINGELQENREITMKYGATGSSLWIGVYDDKGFHKEQNIQVWYKINNKEEYMAYLKGAIQKRLEGDYS